MHMQTYTYSYVIGTYIDPKTQAEKQRDENVVYLKRILTSGLWMRPLLMLGPTTSSLLLNQLSNSTNFSG